MPMPWRAGLGAQCRCESRSVIGWNGQVINKKIVAARSSAAAFLVKSFLALQDDVLGLCARHLPEFDAVCAASLDGVHSHDFH